MGIQERKLREHDERRKLILMYAKELIIERGVESVTMQDIAKKVELSKATLYLYFKSKEAILEEIFDEAGSDFINYVESRMSKDDSGLMAIRNLWMSYIEVFGKSRDIFVLFGIQNFIAPGYPYLIDNMAKATAQTDNAPFKLFRLIVSVLEHGVADGTLDPSIHPVDVARTLFLITSGIIQNASRLPPHLRESGIILAEMKSTFEIVLRGLAAEGGDRSLLTLSIE